jgi:hypothetical protein
VFDLEGAIVNHGNFSIDGTTLQVDGGPATGRPLSATYHLGAPAAVTFGAAAPSSSGALDTSIPVTLTGVIPRHWTIAANSMTATGAGNDGTLDWDGNGIFAGGGTFVNSGSLNVQDSYISASVAHLVNGAGGKVVLSATINFAVSGPSTSGMLAMAGSAALNGTLVAQKLPGYVPHKGDAQQVVSAHSISGRFRHVTHAGLGSTVTYGPTGVTLQVQ